MKTTFYVGLHQNDDYLLKFNVDAPVSIENKGTSIYYDLFYLLDNNLLKVYNYFRPDFDLSEELIQHLREGEDILFLEVEYVRYIFENGEREKQIFTLESNGVDYDKIMEMTNKIMKKGREKE